jgi:hypothetical protein
MLDAYPSIEVNDYNMRYLDDAILEDLFERLSVSRQVAQDNSKVSAHEFTVTRQPPSQRDLPSTAVRPATVKNQIK